MGNDGFADMTIFHIPESLARDFKEFCRVHASNRYGMGLELLLNSFKEKESYLFLLSEVSSLRKELEDLKIKLSELSPKKDEEKVIKTFGGVIKV